MIETGKIINGDCVEVMKTLPEGSGSNCHITTLRSWN